MPIATLRFKLPEEAAEFRIALAAGAMDSMLRDIAKELRDTRKYGTAPFSESEFYSYLSEYNLKLED